MKTNKRNVKYSDCSYTVAVKALLLIVIYLILFSCKALGCEVRSSWLYVGETEAEATDNPYTYRSICDTSTSYWFRARWRAYDSGTPGSGVDNDFHVEVHDMTEDVSVWEEDDIEDEDPGSTQQVVDDVTSPASALDQEEHELRSYAKRVDVGEWVESSEAYMNICDCDLGCTAKEQYKDTQLVCIRGCPKTGTHRWDADHGSRSCNHDARYCAAAGIAIMADYFSGSVSQDRITYKSNGNLNHYSWMYHEAIKTTLAWALNEIPESISEIESPSYSFIRLQICSEIPLLARHPTGPSSGHIVVIDGCHKSGSTEYIHVLDPWFGTGSDKNLSTYEIEKIWISPADASARDDESSVSTDTDSDGLMDFDEINRFSGSPYNFSSSSADSDSDGTDDKDELINIVF